MRAQPPRRPSPDRMQHSVKKLAALRSCQTGLGGLPALRSKPRCGESFERALRLHGENARAATDSAGYEWNAAEILKCDCQWRLAGWQSQLTRQRLRRAGKLRRSGETSATQYSQPALRS